jgi:gliding motility-associated lipoprotein GldH
MYCNPYAVIPKITIDMPRSFLLILLVAASLFSACVPSPYYQKSVSIPGNKWSQQFRPEFAVDIDDTTSFYSLEFLVRHTNAYAYSNIWLWVYTKKPGDTTFEKTRIEIPLSDASGHWLGNGMGEIWEQRRMITAPDDPEILKKKGRYLIRFEQNMRDPLLADVLHVGLRVSKGNKKK